MTKIFPSENKGRAMWAPGSAQEHFADNAIDVLGTEVNSLYGSYGT